MVKRILNTVTGKYYKLRERTTSAGNVGQIMGLWSPKKAIKPNKQNLSKKHTKVKSMRTTQSWDNLIDSGNHLLACPNCGSNKWDDRESYTMPYNGKCGNKKYDWGDLHLYCKHCNRDFRECPDCGGIMEEMEEVMDDRRPYGNPDSGDEEFVITLQVGFECLNPKCRYTIDIKSGTKGTGILR